MLVKRPRPLACSTHAGFTLFEVLIALLVLSLGLLGMAGMQTMSLRNNHSAFLRSQASVLANDILDRMRVNRDLANTYQIDFSESVPSSVNCAVTACTPGQMAVYDLSQWKAALAAKLPAGDGRIVPVSGNLYQVRVSWDDSRGEDNRLEFSTTAEP